ncbi:MAG TPA: hypothetical protein VJ723_13315 [Candidatus Angelobacter sp.]|nr:hypothetical protein [Candidatus Angelobacter sp.]
MRHFTIEEWADFARNVASSDDAGQMQEHLGGGCGKCAQTLAIMKSVATVGAREGNYEPPASAVRMGKLLMDSQRLGAVKKRVSEIWPLVFDSFMQPAMAGVRVALTTSRQLLYRQGDCCIDIRLEQALGANDMSLMGQVLDGGELGRGPGAIPVELLSGEKKIAGTATNNFGEFQFLFPVAGDLQLRVGPSSESYVCINIPRLVPPSTDLL